MTVSSASAVGVLPTGPCALSLVITVEPAAAASGTSMLAAAQLPSDEKMAAPSRIWLS